MRSMDIESHLLIISDKGQNDIDAQGSMTYLYETFRGFVYNAILKNIHFNLNKEETALIVMSNVFMHVWDNPLDWEFDTSKHKTQEGGYKSYLSVVAKFKLLEELRKSQESRENEENIIDDCLTEFSQKKQDIIRMYFLLYEDSKNMNSQNIKLMETMFETTWQNIRQTISRAKREIKKVIESKAVNK